MFDEIYVFTKILSVVFDFHPLILSLLLAHNKLRTKRLFLGKKELFFHARSLAPRGRGKKAVFVSLKFGSCFFVVFTRKKCYHSTDYYCFVVGSYGIFFPERKERKGGKTKKATKSKLK